MIKRYLDAASVLAVILMISSLSASALAAQDAPKKKLPPAMAQIEDDPALPRVLIIGDSISVGYTLPTRQLLKGKANLHRPPTNCGPTTRGLEMIDDWLGDKPWDVIHFNFGLHDMKYMNEQGDLVHVNRGRQQVSIDDYAKHLDQLVQRLKQTQATLIWRNTTPVPEGAKGRVPEDAVRYNRAAAEVMQRHGVQIHNLYSFAKKHEEEIQQPRNVHYTQEGSKRLAEEVAKVIEAALAK